MTAPVAVLAWAASLLLTAAAWALPAPLAPAGGADRSPCWRQATMAGPTFATVGAVVAGRRPATASDGWS